MDTVKNQPITSKHFCKRYSFKEEHLHDFCNFSVNYILISILDRFSFSYLVTSLKKIANVYHSKRLMHMILCLVVELLSVGVNAKSHSSQPVQFIGRTHWYNDKNVYSSAEEWTGHYLPQSHDLTLD